jgi:hypothetical protein
MLVDSFCCQLQHNDHQISASLMLQEEATVDGVMGILFMTTWEALMAVDTLPQI